MDRNIEYNGSPEEWRKINSKYVPVYSTAKRKKKPAEKRYKLIYGKETILPNATFENCVARRELLKRTQPENYKLQTFKIISNEQN